MIERSPLLLILILFCCCSIGCNSDEQAEQIAVMSIPDTSLSVPLERWPNAEDLAKLERLKGKGPTDIIKLIGHPKRLELSENGDWKWHYDWQVACYLSLKNDVVDRWFYTAGY